MVNTELKDTIIFFHGYSGSPTDYNNLPKEIERKFKVKILVPLLPGHLESPENLVRYNYSDFSEFASKIVEQEAAIANRIIIFGFSMGSFLALEALQNPKVIGALVFHTPFALNFPFGLPLMHILVRVKLFYKKHTPSEEELWQANHFRYDRVPSKILSVIYEGSRHLSKSKSFKPVIFFQSEDDRFIKPQLSERIRSNFPNSRVLHYSLGSRTHNPFYYPNNERIKDEIDRSLKKMLFFRLVKKYILFHFVFIKNET